MSRNPPSHAKKKLRQTVISNQAALLSRFSLTRQSTVAFSRSKLISDSGCDSCGEQTTAQGQALGLASLQGALADETLLQPTRYQQSFG